MSTAPAPLKQRRKRVDCQYTAVERIVMEKYKNEYRSQPTRKLRAQVFRSKILVDMFNYWHCKNDAPKDENDSNERIKRLAAWLANNWRPLTSADAEPKIKIRYTTLDVIWKDYRDRVDEELKVILDVEEIDPSMPGVFQQRTAASKRVLNKMSAAEKEELHQKVEKYRKEGLPPDIQKQLAMKHLEKRIEKFEDERWKEMGALVLIFTVHTNPDGRLVVDRFERIADMMGVSTAPFVELHKDKVDEMKRNLMDYVKTIRQLKGPDKPGSGEASTLPADVGLPAEDNLPADTGLPADIQVMTSPTGYPLVPNVDDWSKLRKKDLELILRTYLGRHYRLASGSNRSVPYNAIENSTSNFVKQRYRPAKLTIKDPRNMTKESIVRLLEHIFNRQEDEIEDAFQFHKYVHKKQLKPSEYAANIRPTPGKTPIGVDLALATMGNPKEKSRYTGKARDMSTNTQFPDTRDHSGAEAASLPRSIPIAEEHVIDKFGKNQVIDDDIIRLDYGSMQKMHSVGFHMPLAANGPNDGPPEYLVPRSLWRQTQKQLNSPQVSKTCPVQKVVIDPMLLDEDRVAAAARKVAAGKSKVGELRRSTRNSIKKPSKRRNADASMLMEAEQYIDLKAGRRQKRRRVG